MIEYVLSGNFTRDLKILEKLNGKTIEIDYIQDSGHGWLKIPKNLSFGLKFSRYSYEDEKNLYLEEDLDMGKYIQFLKKHNITVKCNEIIYNGNCYIRNLKRIQEQYEQ